MSYTLSYTPHTYISTVSPAFKFESIQSIRQQGLQQQKTGCQHYHNTKAKPEQSEKPKSTISRLCKHAQ